MSGQRILGTSTVIALLGIGCISLLSGRSSVGLAGLVLAAAALAVALFNLYVTFLRPWVYRRRRGTSEGYRFVSGLPAIGTTLAVLAIIASWGNLIVSVTALVVFAMDTGGIPWFVVTTWRDATLWENRERQ